jgi:hypothetical protein
MYHARYTEERNVTCKKVTNIRNIEDVIWKGNIILIFENIMLHGREKFKLAI